VAEFVCGVRCNHLRRGVRGVYGAHSVFLGCWVGVAGWLLLFPVRAVRG
jgi:hypothetical protein